MSKMAAICKNCQFWKNDPQEQGIDKRFGACSKLDISTCDPNGKNNPDDSIIHLKVSDDDWYFGYDVGENFGCVHFTAKDQYDMQCAVRYYPASTMYGRDHNGYVLSSDRSIWVNTYVAKPATRKNSIKPGNHGN